MRSDQQGFFYTLLNKEYFESLDRYQPSPELRSVVAHCVDEGWEVRPNGFWTYCIPKQVPPAAQGWKIHVSTAPQTARETLERVVPLLVEERTPFKFCSDGRMTRLSTSKNWPRTGAGKFITVYPRDDEQFTCLIERCHQATHAMRGPHILSDRPYKDSKVIFYRYGEHRGAHRISAAGQRVPVVTSPDGVHSSDARTPFFRLPSWLKDPFGGTEPSRTAPRADIVLNGRYRVTGAIKYSSTGGIYSAIDTATGEPVVIREARPMLANRNDASDALTLLEKEARILRKLGHTGYLPRFVDLFREWEHLFLVQEKLDTQMVWTYALGWSNGASPTRMPAPAEMFETIRDMIRQLAQGLKVVHESQVVLRDFTKTNVLVTADRRVKFVDFELAYELDRDELPIIGSTPGYASPQQLLNETPSPEDDYYALGALILDLLSYNAAGYSLNPRGTLAALDLILADWGLPTALRDVVVGLTAQDRRARWTPERAVTALDEVSGLATAPAVHVPIGAPPQRPAPDDALRREVETTIDGITQFILSTPDYSRTDRLWPASPDVFVTNPLGIQFGAAGIANYLWRTTGDVPDAVLDWIREGLRRHVCAPALYNGLSGVALTFLNVGLDAEAKEVLERSRQMELIFEHPGLYYGAAGWGLANLHFWRQTGERAYLDRALEVGERLRRTACSDEDGLYWETDGLVKFGLGHGQSGVAAFFLYLNAAQPDDRFLTAAEQALTFDMAHGEHLDDGRIHWFQDRSVTAGPRLPHLRYGTAGVGCAALRFYAVTGEPRFRRFADACAQTAAIRHSNKLWQDFGLAGFGEFLLDMYHFLGDERYLNNAYYIATGILPNRIEKPSGVAFLGLEQLRLSCDVGMGSAGIGLFLHRLLNPQFPQLLLPDEMLLANEPREKFVETTRRVDGGAELCAAALPA